MGSVGLAFSSVQTTLPNCPLGGPGPVTSLQGSQMSLPYSRKSCRTQHTCSEQVCYPTLVTPSSHHALCKVAFFHTVSQVTVDYDNGCAVLTCLLGTSLTASFHGGSVWPLRALWVVEQLGSLFTQPAVSRGLYSSPGHQSSSENVRRVEVEI